MIHRLIPPSPLSDGAMCRRFGHVGRVLRSLLAVTLSVAGLAALSQASPAGAQNVQTVTRTLANNVSIQMPAGKFYGVVDHSTGERRATVREGESSTYAIVLGETPDAADPPQFTCTTYDGTATQGTDYTSGASQTTANAVVNTLTTTTLTEWAASPLTANAWDPSEYYTVRCIPDEDYYDAWTAWGEPNYRVTILDQVEPETPPTSTRTVSLSSGPTISATAPTGKFYSVWLHQGGGITGAEREVNEGDIGELVVSLGENASTGDLSFNCTTIADTADANDYVPASAPATPNTSGTGFTLPMTTKKDSEFEIDEYYWVECMPTGGTERNEWRAWPSPRARLKIVDTTTRVSFTDTNFTIREGSSASVSVIADSSIARAKGARDGAISVVLSFDNTGIGVTAQHPQDIRFSGTQAVSLTQTLGSTSISPQTITIQAVNNSVCDYDKLARINLSPTSAAEWTESGTGVGGFRYALVKILDDQQDAPPAPEALAAAVNGSSLEVDWLESRCPHLEGVELEYRAFGAATWIPGLRAGRQWNYDGDGNPQNNLPLTTSHTLTGLAAGTAYEIRVRYHNAGGASPWKESL